MKYFLTLLGYLVLNFGGLWLGSTATTPGVVSEWYTSLNQAPWTPPGWVFAAAWTLIGITFSVFMANESKNQEENPIPKAFFVESFILNVCWNFIFFLEHTLVAGIVISLLSVIIFLMAHYTRVTSGWRRMLWIMPYFIWLMIASSLNWYIVIMN